MLIRLHRQAPESFGFNLLEAYPETVYRIWTFGFLEDSDRDEAFAKWKSWSEETPPKKTKKTKPARKHRWRAARRTKRPQQKPSQPQAGTIRHERERLEERIR